VQSLFVPQVRAAAALSSGDAAKAIELLKPANAYDKANTQVLYIRGLACWKAGLGTVVYAHMQAVGMVNDHLVDCFRYRQLRQNWKTVSST
jgi:3-methyladenine DNA glycosylase Tag